MEVHLTADREAFVRRRMELLAAVDRAEASFARGEGRTIATHEDVTRLAADVKRRGMARLAAERNPAE
jgi:hypothetical protein